MDSPNSPPKNFSIGFCCGTEWSYPEAVAGLLKRVSEGLPLRDTGRFRFEYIPVLPLKLSEKIDFTIIIDRVSHWRPFVKEFLKTALLDGVYVINNPHHVESKKKNFGFSAMERLGLPVPYTLLLPPKDNFGVPHEVLERFNRPFDLREMGGATQFPSYLKPHDGGGWRNVMSCENQDALDRAYDASGKMVMNLQRGIKFDKYARCLCIGDYVLPIEYNPESPFHQRYTQREEFLTPEERVTIIRYCHFINAFHGFELNSAEFLLKDGVPWLIDFNNPVPDLGVVSLHRYFFWAVKSTVRLIIKYCLGGKPFPHDLNTAAFLAAARNGALSPAEKFQRFDQLVDDFFQTRLTRPVEAEIFTPAYEEEERKFFHSPEFLEIIQKDLRKSFSDETDPEKFNRFFADYLANMGLKGTPGPS